jgi:two-component system cell cycle sensor histidine kinase PleC
MTDEARYGIPEDPPPKTSHWHRRLTDGLPASSWRLVAVGCAAALPIVVFTILLGLFYADDRQRLIEAEMDGTVTALATSIEREVEARFQILTVMADSSDLTRGDLDSFHRELSTYIRRTDQGWFTMALIDPAAKSMVVNTLRPFGAPLPYTSAPAHIGKVVETRQPQVFGVVPSGTIQPKPLIIMGVPVTEGDRVRYVLNGTLFPSILNGVLTRHNFPAAHTVAVIDANGRIAARSREAETFVGAKITESAAAKLAAMDGLRGRFRAFTQEGNEVHTTFQRIPSLGWTVLYGVPETLLRVPLERADRILTPSAVLAVVLSAVLIVLFIRSDNRRRRVEADAAQAAEAAGRREREVLEQARQQAESTSKAKTDFLANMSHELRTPLNAILGFTEALQLGIFGPLQTDKQIEGLRSIHHAGSLLKGCIDDMLDMAQIESGRVILNDSDVDLADLIRACVTTLTPMASGRGQKIEFTSENNVALPKVRVDALRFNQILLNLLNNAVKFTPPGGLITVDADHTPDGWIRLLIRDSGIGIDAEDMELVLQPFGRAASPYVRKQEGTGLGLPLARRLVLLHGGTFHITSRPGTGTSVSLGIPPDRVIQS